MIDLSVGLSGCRLELINDRILRKYSSSDNYNSRLLSQANKQVLFSQRILKNVDSPKVYDIQENYFDMEYIPGHTFLDFFSTSSINDIEFVIDTLFHYFDSCLNHSGLINISPAVNEKIKLLETKTSYKDYLLNIGTLTVEYDIYVPKTFCHGDLTFTNIIFHKNRIFFIDFLDSYVDSFISDLVKLKQDLYYLWSIKTQRIQSNRLEQIYRHIWKQLSQKYAEFICSDAFHILDAMNMLRIEPYLTSSHQRIILDTILKSTELYANFSGSYGGKI
ncbi:MAG: phosphotransferase [Candidatus Fonsibacter ubiquis]